MDQHALAILKDAQSWKLPIAQHDPESGRTGSKFRAVFASLLYWLVFESQKLGGTVLDQFWLQLENCNPAFRENIQKLRVTPFDSRLPQQSSTILFEGVDREKAEFAPLLQMAAEYFTHLGVAFSEIISQETEELLELASNCKTYGQRKQEILKALSFKRDGISCPVTNVPFRPNNRQGVKPILAHVVPHSAHENSDTLKCVAMFAGRGTRDKVISCLNDIDNVVNLQMDAHDTYSAMEWGIEAKEENEEVRYIYRRIPHETMAGPGFIRLKDGDEIMFGQGPDGERLNKGPFPMLCNFQLAVARALKMSAAADIILELKDAGDDSNFPHVFIASEEFCDILDAKLLLSGQALVT